MVESKKPLVSVLIASYNHAQYIEASINSVLRQTYNNIELIVIDDGSSDDSNRLLSILSAESGFSYSRQKNMGLAATLNKAFSMAKGKYIAPFSSDDIMMLDRIEKQVEFMEKREDVGATGGNILKINGEGGLYMEQDKMAPYREFGFKELFVYSRNAPAAPTVLIRRDVLEEVGGWNPNIQLEDLYMLLKITHLGKKIVVLNDVMAFYRLHDANTTKNTRYMYEHILKTYDCFSAEDNYLDVRNRFLSSMFLKASKKDKRLAIEILHEIPVSSWSSKTLKGLIRLLVS